MRFVLYLTSERVVHLGKVVMSVQSSNFENTSVERVDVIGQPRR